MEMGDGNDWLKIDFNKKVHPSKIKMQANTNYNLPKIIDISMSIDDIVYDYIDTININVTDTDIHEFIFKQPKKNYRFVKFNFPEKTEWIEINRIELYQTNSLNIIKDTNLNYFSINSDFYNKNLKAYIPLNSFSSSNINELITETGFMLENINNIIQLDDETFKPINKFKDFKIIKLIQ